MDKSPLDLDDALAAILADINPVEGVDEVHLPDALGRVLAQAVDAPVSLPAFAASAMDGYAVRSAELTGEPPYRLRVMGTSYAGRPLEGATPEGGCVRIFTGAPVPDDLDAVVIQENCRSQDDHVWIGVPVASGANVRPVGHDVAAGTRILEPGRRLTQFDLAWLAASGIGRLQVLEKPLIGLFSTGDELLEAGATPRLGQIFDSNRLALRLLMQNLPVEIRDFGIVPDDRERIRAVLEAAGACCHLIVTSGGVSVGEADWVRDAVADVGTLTLWKLNLKPGKPLAYGRLGRAAFFGLPGNPVSTIVTALMLTRPAIERLCGTTPRPLLTVTARLRGSLEHQPGREEFLRGALTSTADGPEVSVTGDQSSNRLATFAHADCFIRVPKDCGSLTDGSTVAVLPFWGLLASS